MKTIESLKGNPEFGNLTLTLQPKGHPVLIGGHATIQLTRRSGMGAEFRVGGNSHFTFIKYTDSVELLEDVVVTPIKVKGRGASVVFTAPKSLKIAIDKGQ